jgi:hypothetical protein
MMSVNSPVYGRELFKVDLPTLVVNDHSSQRSRIVSMQFNMPVEMDVTIFQNPGAVTLTRTAGGPADVVTIGSGLIVTPGAGHSRFIRLTFTGSSNPGLENRSLADGRWQLAIPSLNYSTPMNDANLRRLFGDEDANGTVDAADFGSFGSVFGGTSVAFDFDNNGAIDASDFSEFGDRFGRTL